MYGYLNKTSRRAVRINVLSYEFELLDITLGHVISRSGDLTHLVLRRVNTQHINYWI